MGAEGKSTCKDLHGTIAADVLRAGLEGALKERNDLIASLVVRQWQLAFYRGMEGRHGHNR